jgi:hypothetical protein
MAKEKRRGMRFYAEMIIVTVLSLVAANLWIEYVKGFILRNFPNDPAALIIAALIITFVAIALLHILFSDLPKGEEGYKKIKFD